MGGSVSVAEDGTLRSRVSASPRITAVAACLLTLGAARQAGAQAAAPPVRRYESPEYLFTVRYPLGLPIARSSGPEPNHGMGVEVAPGAQAWVFAGYELESASTLEQEAAEQPHAGRGVRVHRGGGGPHLEAPVDPTASVRRRQGDRDRGTPAGPPHQTFC